MVGPNPDNRKEQSVKQRMRSAWQLWRGQARTAKLCLALAALSVAAALLLSSGTLCYAVSSQDLVREQAITPAAQPARARADGVSGARLAGADVAP